MKFSSFLPEKQSVTDINWDFSNIGEFLNYGFSDYQLEYLCKNITRKDFPNQNPPFTYFWQSEVYGFGRCLRRMLNWPVFLPLPFHIDHGGDPAFDLYDHDIKSPAKFHICYFDAKYLNIKENFKNKIPVRILHPYVFYRRSAGYSLSSTANGCILFVPSSIPGINTDNVVSSVESAIKEIKTLTHQNIKIALCLHFHDVNAGLHYQLRTFNLPLFTCGNPSCQLFVDRFYRIVSNYIYASTPNPMSALYYCTELGLSPIVAGERTMKTNISNKEMALGNLDSTHSEDQKLIHLQEHKIYKNRCDTQSISDWCSRVLGLDVESNYLRRYKIYFYIELLRLFPIVLIKKLKFFFTKN